MDEPLYCTLCGAEDKDCTHGFAGDDGRGPFCESGFVHEWSVDDDEAAHCIQCGLRAKLYVTKKEGPDKCGF